MRRLRSEKAIQLAMQNRWREAVDVNRQILDHFPDDVDTLNRLGKALMELGQYAEARDEYAKAAKADPSNGIAARNLVRLTKLAEEATTSRVVAVAHTQRMDLSIFMEESGKTAVTSLVDRAPFEEIATLTAGEKLMLRVESDVVQGIGPGDGVVGQLEPKIGQRLMRLVAAGNRYSAVIMSIDEQHVQIIIREEYRDPSMRLRPSFPTQGPETRPYTRDNIFRTDLDDEDDDALDDVDADIEMTGSAGGGADTPKDADEDDDSDDDK